MKNALAMIILFGFSGGAYAGSALEQLNATGGGLGRQSVPAVSKVVPVGSKAEGVADLQNKMKVLENMFNAGQPFPQGKLQERESKGVMIGVYSSVKVPALNGYRASPLSLTKITIMTDLGPLLTPNVRCFNYLVSSNDYPASFRVSATNKELSGERNMLDLSEDTAHMTIELRQNGKYVLGKFKIDGTDLNMFKANGFLYFFEE